ncbi:hypothetical protein MM221_09950 [Salipaludibacillus sp. LMS25]|jgi:hypothetical protein|uniref:hypothetical protein n=1 Tax=Salipaludibacillus sp. LMS25 TaxID=2924031 RepID=UPI0020D11EAC|nr:hypothetical protein [Salipaludibacillus sp. LMS25]UTR16804.1 hypothetical protein MM221_09950 [Salipaludibacillus sp. LMS25]
MNEQEWLLLVNESDETVQMLYNHNPYTWSMPKIGPRPPFYTNVRVEENYPLF